MTANEEPVILRVSSDGRINAYGYMCIHEVRICVYMSVYADPLGLS